MNSIQFTGLDGVSVHDSEFVTLLSGEGEAVEDLKQEPVAESGDPLFPEMAWRISATGEPGELQASRVIIWFTALRDSPANGPVIWPNLTVTVPEESDGAIYLIYTYFPEALSLEFSETRLVPGANRYVRPIANVSRGTGDTVTFSQRHIGILTIPAQGVYSQFL